LETDATASRLGQCPLRVLEATVWCRVMVGRSFHITGHLTS